MMNRRTWYLAVSTLGALSLTASSLLAAGKPELPSSSTVGHADDDHTSLVRRAVAPHSTDPDIDIALNDHLVWVDTRAKSNHKLFLFLPGSRAEPADFQLIQEEAARVGHHVIGLMYPNSPGLVSFCP